MKTIAVTKENYEELKELYRKAEKSGLDKFKFQGEFLVTGYAKYVLQYMEMKL